MNNKLVRIAVGTGISLLVLNSTNINALASTVNVSSVSNNSVSGSSNTASTAVTGRISAVLPSGGVNLNLSKAPSLDSLQGTNTGIQIEKVLELSTVKELQAAQAAAAEEEFYRNLVIADVNNYVNVRNIPDAEGEVVGKLYDNSAGTFISEQNGWYEIKSGSVTGFVKAEYCVTGEAAIELAKEVGTRIAVVNTTTLFVRQEPGTESSVMGMVPLEEELVVTEEVDGWVKVSIEEGEGYVSTDYVNLRTDFVQAESKAEEEARLEKEREERRKAQEAARAAQASRQEGQNKNSSNKQNTSTPAYTSDGSMGAEVAAYALQFVGNPYVYGGTSLTNGADCSGFVMSVYANFGVSLSRTSTSQRSEGYAVDGLANAQPGDIICYSGHVGIYIGNNQIVHASTAKTGIKVSSADYRKVLAVRRIF